MANTSRAIGLRPVGNISGAAWTGKATPYYMNANGGGADGAAACGVGSVVSILGTASEDLNGLRVVRTLNNGYMTAGEATAVASIASIPVGVVVGFDILPTDLNLSGSYRAISTARLVYVCDDPNTLFEIQEDSNGGNLAANSVGLNATVTTETVSTTTGLSNLQLDTSAVAATASFPLRILAFARRVDNEVSSSYAKVIVKFTRHANATTDLMTTTTNAGI